MTTEELKKKLKINQNTCIHCPTLELAKQVLGIFRQLGLKWCDKTNYTKHTYWNRYKENTIYCPFGGYYFPLEFVQEEDYKIISAEEFIALHTEEKEFDLENYEPKGELTGFPKEVIKQMLDYQVEQGNKRNISIFENNRRASICYNGFYWDETKEGDSFWHEVIREKNFNLFFKKYPKQDNQDNSQEFRVGDEVIDIISGRRGKVTYIDALNKDSSPLFVDYNEVARFTLDGRYCSDDKHPRLLHYRDDYNYDVIDFNNLPQRQEPKRWRAKKRESYYFIKRDNYNNLLDRVRENKDNYDYISNEQYKIGNYFKTKEEAEEIAEKMNTYFQKLIKI